LLRVDLKTPVSRPLSLGIYVSYSVSYPALAGEFDRAGSSQKCLSLVSNSVSQKCLSLEHCLLLGISGSNSVSQKYLSLEHCLLLDISVSNSVSYPALAGEFAGAAA